MDIKSFPTKLPWKEGGVCLPFFNNNKYVLYYKGTDPSFVFSYVESLFEWADKTFLHAGAVSDGCNAYIFTGGGGVGKTSLVLGLLQNLNMYRFMSDDWLILGKNLAFPYPKRIRIYDYNVINDKTIGRRLFGFKYPLVLTYLKSLNKLRRKFPSKTIRFLLHNYNYVRLVDVNDICNCLKEIQPLPIGKIFLLTKGSSQKILKHETDHERLAYLLSRVNYYERLYLYHEYYKYLINSFYKTEITVKLEDRIQKDYELFREAFRNKEIYVLEMPTINDSTLKEILNLLIESG
jgi:GTPase SAR1 family protein